MAAAVAWLAGWSGWQATLVASTVVSLVLTSLAWSMAFRGAVVDMVNLALVWIGPRVVPSVAAG